MKLIIVESPTKARTISRFFDQSYKVIASVGHIRDLPKSNRKAIDIPAGFVPNYEIPKVKEKIVLEIKGESKKSDEIFLATDPDREGEAIAWHIAETINPKKTKSETKNSKLKRIAFHEITEHAIKEALNNPRGIDMDLVRAQEARRVLDRIVGYDLSGLIWKKVRYGLSAGRVQSPALRILVEREREIRSFNPKKFWVIKADFETEKKESISLTCDTQPNTKEDVNRIIVAAKSHPWNVVSVKKTRIKRAPRAPFTTSTLQQAANSRLGFSPSRTMSSAQKLYEQGLITYMRTDSVLIGEEALLQIRNEVETFFGNRLVSPRTFRTKSKLAQEAHEAIRPTSIQKHSTGATEEQKKMYKLIWERTIASQMSDAEIERTKISAATQGGEKIPTFSTTGNIMLSPGWLLADPHARGEDVEVPAVKEGDALFLKKIEDKEKETEPPPRYTEAGLVKELEKRGIGRPSTYASIIRTLSDRGYVEKEKRVLRPTDTGEVVSKFLEENFSKYVSDSFTAEMEDELDEIAKGSKEYAKTLKEFYIPFSKAVKSKENIEKLTTLGEADGKHACPKCGGQMVIKLGKGGKFLSCKKFPECQGARKINGDMIEGPKETGEECPECGGKLVEREGKYGKFVSCANYPKCKYIKISKEEEARRKTGVKCPKCEDGDIVERKGRFGEFFSCSNYPKCSFIMKSKPTGNICQECGALMMQGTKTIPERCSNKACSYHNPHKLEK